MAASETHYDILRLDARASPQRVRQAYRRMAQKYHPDRYRGRGDSAAVMARINEAYAVLSDESRRAAYDESLAHTGHASQLRSHGAAMAAFVQDRIGWAGWLLLVIASVSVLTLGYVALRTAAPVRPVFQAPGATTAPVPVADNAPLAPIAPIQPWTEPPRTAIPANEATDPVRRLVRDGVIDKSRAGEQKR